MQRAKELLKRKDVAIFLSVVLLISFGWFVVEMVDSVGSGDVKVLLETSHGNITLLLYGDTPITTNNFVNLVNKKTYDGVIFHRVIAGFMVQGGDPTGTGYGDPSIATIKDEFIKGHSNIRGAIAMANTGTPNSGSSQFFINLVDNVGLDFDKAPLASKHPVFGKVVSGMDIVDEIATVKVGSNAKPLEDIVISKARIL
jgi:peptidylprolyl isomerase